MFVVSNLKEKVKEEGHHDALLDALLDCIMILESHDRKELERVRDNLKGKGGEDWAVGEMLQRVIYFLGNTYAFED